MEENLGVTLIESSPGGRTGGNSRLSPEGRRFVQRYERFRTKAERDLQRVFNASTARNSAAQVDRWSGQQMRTDGEQMIRGLA
jgi:molybdate transport repressor ModE-like protein